MAEPSQELVLPRPGASVTQPPIAGPSETSFCDTFGSLLPPATYVRTEYGKAAYYSFPPRQSTLDSKRILLLHGVQTPALGLFALTTALKSANPQHHFVLVDLWGHGLSDTPMAPHVASLFHRLFDAVLDELDWSVVHLFGYSLGAMLAASYAVARPTRVQSFILAAPAGLIKTAGFTEEQRGYLRGEDEHRARQWIHTFLEGGPLVVPDDWEARVAKGQIIAPALRQWQLTNHPGHAASVVALFRDVGVLDNAAVFHRASLTGIPALVILGELDDMSTSAEFEQVGLQNIVTIPKGTHGIVRDRVAEVEAATSSFWAGLS